MVNNTQKDKRVVNVVSWKTNFNFNVLWKDIVFLRDQDLMDYSLYLTVEKVDKVDKKLETRNRFYSIDGTELYHIGLIDYLQTWNLAKKTERTIKWLTKDIKGISAVEPKYYCKRFGEFMRTEVFTVPHEDPEDALTVIKEEIETTSSKKNVLSLSDSGIKRQMT